jgi:hypothetical protein
MGYAWQTVKKAVDQLKCIRIMQMFDIFAKMCPEIGLQEL